jgi:PhoH-like ATPase
VLLHDPHSLFKFKEHDVFIPFVTVEELDGKKAGSGDVNRNARQATRLIEEVLTAGACEGLRPEGYPLAGFNGGACSGSLLVQQELLGFLPNEFVHKNDNLYLAVLRHLVERKTHEQVIMVTKDLNLRIKARALGFVSEDYLHDHSIDDADLIYKGLRHVDEETLNRWGAGLKATKEG